MAVNGIDTSAASAIASKNKQTGNNTLDKDAFLKLLVTQMQYQDPLEPTDNTEWMSQMAQFSQMEAMNNLNTAFENTQALGLVGQYVLLNTTDSSGAQKQIGGLVQYVTISNGQALLRVNDEYYSADSLDSVVDIQYLEWINSQIEAGKTEGEGNNGGEGGNGGEA
ncbi:MAG: hypothetical protein K2N24_06995 [Lachnospiraceae bacterium]|nr:hypothetical protein [Lachnospiraceae bacterium]